MTVHVEVLRDVTTEAVEAFGRLLPQLSASAAPLDQESLGAIVEAPTNTVLIARTNGVISGALTLVMFTIPTGLRAWIEDVVVDQSARGQGIGEALSLEALRLARAAGARPGDLTPRPSREPAPRPYHRPPFPH